MGTVTYTITIPVDQPTTGLGSSVSVESITNTLSTTLAADITLELQTNLASAGVTYTVEVKALPPPVVSFETRTTTTTTAGDVVEDSFAFSKVAFCPANVLALLVVAT